MSEGSGRYANFLMLKSLVAPVPAPPPPPRWAERASEGVKGHGIWLDSFDREGNRKTKFPGGLTIKAVKKFMSKHIPFFLRKGDITSLGHTACCCTHCINS